MMQTIFLIVIIGISAATNDPASHHIESISIVGAVALLATYLLSGSSTTSGGTSVVSFRKASLRSR